MTARLRLPALFLGFAVCSAASLTDAKVIERAAVGTPALRAIDVLTFADDGVLLVGDGAGSQIVAIETGDTTAKKRSWKKIDGFDKKVAARLGTTPKGISIVDVAVNPKSGTVYVAVRKQDERKYLIVTVDPAGSIGDFELEKVKYARVKLSAGKVRISRITDVAWADGRIIAAGRGTGTFTSKIFSINAPLTHDTGGEIYSAETYHVSHRRWETRAPMSVLIPYKENGKTYVVGAFSCTPVVKFPIDNIKTGAQVKGVSMIELGSGNRPLDMIIYEKNKKSYVLANTYRFKRNLFGPSRYWTVRFEQGLLGGSEKVNEKAVRRLRGAKSATPRINVADAFHGVIQMDKLDSGHAVVLREGKAGVSLEVLPLP
ncbi:MAG: hypothetical protein ACE5KM_01300 [Planctomycetaceae bacterium]